MATSTSRGHPTRYNAGCWRWADTGKPVTDECLCAKCKTGPVMLSVPMPSHTKDFRWAKKPVDRCIAPIVQALNDGGVYTSNCCCGHGDGDGMIILHDGRVLEIVDKKKEETEK